MPDAAHAARVLRLYAALLRACRTLPGRSRQAFARRRVREEFRAGASLSDAGAIAEQLVYAEVQLETLAGLAGGARGCH